MIVLLACDPGAAKFETGDTGAIDADSDSESASESASESDESAEDSASDTAPDSADDGWAALEAGREDALRALAEPIADCVVQVDTHWPAFHGCIDWHSAVHAHWALLTLARVLGEPGWADLVDESLTPEAVAGELDAIEAGSLGEIPYGYAWFLALARERAARGDGDLEPHAALVADALEMWIADVGVDDPAIQTGSYSNYAWALYNLWRWSVATGDATRAARMEGYAVDVLLPSTCPLLEEPGRGDDFFPACLHRALALVHLLPDPAPLLAELPDPYALEPVTDIRAAHDAGLNFSRAWGLWALYTTTGHEPWRDLYVEHVTWHLAHPEYWAEDYYAYAHWVPQFGVYALAATVDDPAP